MDLDRIRAELEEELTWREKEIKLLKNLVQNIIKNEQKKIYRKTLIVMLYSHFEGFVKSCLSIYVSEINKLKIKRKEVNNFIASCSMNKTFKAYESKDKKCSIFKRKLPDDSNLHQLYRQYDFVKEFNNFLEQIVKIPEDTINTHSNLKYEILEKNLYQIGIDHKLFSSFENNINKIVNLRNSIAHGSQKSGFEKEDYDKLEKDILLIMNKILIEIYDRLKNKDYLAS